jgi:hypothetical protein
MELNPAPQGRKKRVPLLRRVKGQSAICMTHHTNIEPFLKGHGFSRDESRATIKWALAPDLLTHTFPIGV